MIVKRVRVCIVVEVDEGTEATVVDTAAAAIEMGLNCARFVRAFVPPRIIRRKGNES